MAGKLYFWWYAWLSKLNHEHEEFCDELNYWECLESANCEWHSFGWWSGDCVNSENEDNDESDENEDETEKKRMRRLLI